MDDLIITFQSFSCVCVSENVAISRDWKLRQTIPFMVINFSTIFRDLFAQGKPMRATRNRGRVPLSFFSSRSGSSLARSLGNPEPSVQLSLHPHDVLAITHTANSTHGVFSRLLFRCQVVIFAPKYQTQNWQPFFLPFDFQCFFAACGSTRVKPT